MEKVELKKQSAANKRKNAIDMLHKKGMSVSSIAIWFNVSRQTVYNALKKT